MKWNEVLTKSQKERLVKEAVEALEKLTSLSEVKDLLKSVCIVRKERGRGDFLCLTLTKNGIVEEFVCTSHSYPTMFDEYESRSCPKKPPNKVKKEDFERVVMAYELIAANIEEVISKLR